MLHALFLCFILALVQCSPDSSPMGPAGKALSTESVEDRNALRDYYRCILEDVNPPEGKLSVLAKGHWMSRSTLAKWHGITINGSGRVVEVNIPSPYKGSEGTWSERNQDAIDQDAFAELTRLGQLQTLNIRGNFLQILIESGSFDNFGQLRSLHLVGNLILPESNFSEFGKLTSLEHLSLSIPVGASAEALCGLTSLKSLDLNLQGTSTIPACLGNLTNLESLSLSGSYFDFSGIWDSSSFRSVFDHDEACPNPIWTDPLGLFVLNCSSYKERVFNGIVVQAADSLALSSLQNLTNLKRLSLNNMGLAAIPPWIGALAELEELHVPVGNYMSGNPLTGPLPPGLGQLRKIKTLHTVASGPLPPEIGDMESLESISIIGPYSDSGARKIEEEGRLLSDNTQHIWSHYSTKFTLEEIEMLPGLEGSLPPEWGKLSNLKSLSLVGYLSGQLPLEWSGMESLESLSLNDLELTGPIPNTWGQLASLERMQLQNNLLSGPLPPEIENMTSLVYLYLSNNQLSGPIPSGITKLKNLEILSLSNNQLTGSLIDFSDMRSLEYIGLSGNQLSGTINGRHFPMSIKGIGLRENDFSGEFPYLAHLVNLRSFSHDPHAFGALSYTDVCPRLPPILKENGMWSCGSGYVYSEGSS